MAQITLYGPRPAPFTHKVELALRFKDLDYVLVEPRGPEDFRRWSPETGLLPAIEDGPVRVADSTRILEYLEDQYPEPSLLSPDPKTADAQRRLEDWCDESFFFYWLRWQRLRDELAGRPARPFGLRAWLRSLARGEAFGEGGGGQDPFGDLLEQLERRCDDLVNLLGGRPFFYADSPSFADLAVYAMLVSMRAGNFPNGPQLVASRPSLVELMKRVEEATS